MPHSNKLSRKRIRKALDQASPSQEHVDKLCASVLDDKTSSWSVTKRSVDVDRADPSLKQLYAICPDA